MIRVIHKRSFQRGLLVTAVAIAATTIGVFAIGNVMLSWFLGVLDGNQITFQGRTMTLPYSWRIIRNQHLTEELHLDRALLGSFVTHHLIIEAPGNVTPYDEKSILAWQSAVSTRGRDGSAVKNELVNLQSARFQFHCVIQRGQNFSASELQCRASGLNWTVMYRGGPVGLSEAEQILRSTE
jgi:hypothetical protein